MACTAVPFGKVQPANRGPGQYPAWRRAVLLVDYLMRKIRPQKGLATHESQYTTPMVMQPMVMQPVYPTPGDVLRHPFVKQISRNRMELSSDRP
jgi:hypothetical protein